MPWLVQQIKNRNDDGAMAIYIAPFLGPGSKTEHNRGVRAVLADPFYGADGNKQWLRQSRTSRRISCTRGLRLRFPGAMTGRSSAQFKGFTWRTRADTESSVRLYYAYALSWMDQGHACDYWRFISLEMPKSASLTTPS